MENKKCLKPPTSTGPCLPSCLKHLERMSGFPWPRKSTPKVILMFRRYTIDYFREESGTEAFLIIGIEHWSRSPSKEQTPIAICGSHRSLGGEWWRESMPSSSVSSSIRSLPNFIKTKKPMAERPPDHTMIIRIMMRFAPKAEPSEHGKAEFGPSFTRNDWIWFPDYGWH